MLKKTKTNIILLFFTTFIISGCNNNSTTKIEDNNKTEILENNVSIENNATGENNSTENNSTLTGKVIDGEIAGATLFLDLNRNNELDTNEPSTKTDAIV